MTKKDKKSKKNRREELNRSYNLLLAEGHRIMAVDESEEATKRGSSSSSSSSSSGSGSDDESYASFESAQQSTVGTVASYIGAIDATKDDFIYRAIPVNNNASSSSASVVSASASTASVISTSASATTTSVSATSASASSSSGGGVASSSIAASSAATSAPSSDTATMMTSDTMAVTTVATNNNNHRNSIRVSIREQLKGGINNNNYELDESRYSENEEDACSSRMDASMVSVGMPGDSDDDDDDDATTLLEDNNAVVASSSVLEEAIFGGSDRCSGPDDDDEEDDIGSIVSGLTQRTGIGSGAVQQQQLKQQPIMTSAPSSALPPNKKAPPVAVNEFLRPITSTTTTTTTSEKSDRIVRSYRPSISQRFRGASFLAFRRGRSSSSTAAAAASAANFTSESPTPIKSGGGRDDSSPSLMKSETTRTEVTDDDEELGSTTRSSNITTTTNNNNHHELSIGSLLKDTYSFLYIYPACPPSSPFTYALFLFTFQSLVYALLLSSLIDISNPSNMLHVPTVVSMQMRIAQGCAILIAVVNSVDVMVAMNNLLRNPDRIVVMDAYYNFLDNSANNGGGEEIEGLLAVTESSSRGGVASLQGQTSFPVGIKFKFANVLRLIEGCLAVTASFILIVRSDDIIEMFINFAALEFVVNLDNLAFALAEHGLISDRLQDAARFVGGLGFAYHNDSNNHRTRKPSRGGAGSCTSAGRSLAHLKGSYLSRIFGSPVRVMKNNPDRTRRTTLFIMTAVLFGCWSWILSGLNNGDFLCKSLDVEFLHAHISTGASRVAEEDGIKPFLSSRNGNYVAMFMEDGNGTFSDRLLNMLMGKSTFFLAYRKVDPKVESPASQNIVSTARLPQGYEEVVFFDPSIKRWVFTSCDPNADLLRDRVCAGPQVHSIETDVTDLTTLSSSAFHMVDANAVHIPSSMVLPASVTCNECGRQQEVTGLRPTVEYNSLASCGLSGGECSAPEEELGFSRQCLCPPGQYGPFCMDNRGTSCPELEILHIEDANEPIGAAHFLDWEEKAFKLIQDERGVGNTPIWQRRFASKGFTDRVEWRGGTHWTITRYQTSLNIAHTLAIAEVTPAASMDGGGGSSSGGVNASLVAASLNAQPPPAGLTFHAPKQASWEIVPDYFRPFASYQFRCVPAPLVLTGVL